MVNPTNPTGDYMSVEAVSSSLLLPRARRRCLGLVAIRLSYPLPPACDLRAPCRVLALSFGPPFHPSMMLFPFRCDASVGCDPFLGSRESLFDG